MAITEEDYTDGEVKDISPSKFISFEVLKGHLPIMICGDQPPTEEKLDRLADRIAEGLIKAMYRKIMK